MRLKDKIALVTGAGSGIGAAIAELFAREGARVAGVDLNGAHVRTTVARIRRHGGTALAIRANVSREPDVRRMLATCLDTFGTPDILVNNVGTGTGDEGLLATSTDSWERLLAVNLHSVFLCCRAVVPAMVKAGRGAVVNVSSLNGIRGVGQPVYSATKGGVNAMTAALATEYARHGIRFNVVCPGSTETPVWAPVFRRHPGIRKEFGRIYPLGRMGKPADVAYAALYLASDEAAFVTGIVLPVDGGISAGVGMQLPEMVTRWMREAGKGKTPGGGINSWARKQTP